MYPPRLWKLSHIVPIPKIPKPVVHNDFRPIALTPVIMKCFEKLVRNALVPQVKIDPFQFAYQPNKGVEDAIMTLWHKLCEHLDKPKTYVRALFADFSSAFNTIDPNCLKHKLQVMKVHPVLCSWILNFFGK